MIGDEFIVALKKCNAYKNKSPFCKHKANKHLQKWRRNAFIHRDNLGLIFLSQYQLESELILSITFIVYDILNIKL